MTDAVKAARAADLVFITTPDRSIRDVCSALAVARAFKAGALVVHMSGAHSLDLLEDARSAGARRAVLHPLQSLADREQGIERIPGSFFRIEADPDALKDARRLVEILGGVELKLPAWKGDKDSLALYHAGAVTVSNFFVALMDFGLDFYETLGADREEAFQAVLPLIQGTLHNIETLGITAALTGPIARGDVQTVQEHMDAMKRKTPDLVELYRHLASRTVAVARKRDSISQQTAQELMSVLSR